MADPGKALSYNIIGNIGLSDFSEVFVIQVIQPVVKIHATANIWQLYPAFTVAGYLPALFDIADHLNIVVKSVVVYQLQFHGNRQDFFVIDALAG